MQGEPFMWGVEVENISDTPSPEIEISNSHIINLEDNYCSSAENSVVVRPLNPNEKTYVELDKCTVFLEGAMWAKFLVTSRVAGYEIAPYQIDENHDKLMKCNLPEDSHVNWLNDIYIHKKSEVLQGRTNNLIVVLTVVTVLEAVFTIKSCLKFLLWCGVEFFGIFVSLFSFLRSAL